MKKPARANKVVARHQAHVDEKTAQPKRRTFFSSTWAKLGVAIGVVAAMVVGVGIATAKNDDSPLNQVLGQVVPTNSTAILAALPNAAASAGSKHVTEPPRETIERCVAGHNESASCRENAQLNDRWNKLSVQEKVKDPSTMTQLNAANTAHWQEHGVTLPGADYYDQVQKERVAKIAGEQDPAADIQRSAGLNPNKIAAGNKAIAQITAQGGGANNSQFVYDPFGHCVKIVETRNGSVTSTKQFVWNADELCEERDSSGNVTKQFFANGQTIGGTPYYYSRDHIHSVREMTDSSGNVVAQYSYTPDGRVTKVRGNTVDSDFLYAGMYDHQPSSFNLAVHRAYNPSLGRWMSRDPIGERGGLNLFAYAGNNPVNFRDPMGLFAQCHQSCENKCKPFEYNLYRYSQCMEVCEQEGTPKWNDCNAHDSCEPLWGPPYSSPPWVDCMHHCLAGTTPPKPGKQLTTNQPSPGGREVIVTPPRL